MHKDVIVSIQRTIGFMRRCPNESSDSKRLKIFIYSGYLDVSVLSMRRLIAFSLALTCAKHALLTKDKTLQRVQISSRSEVEVVRYEVTTSGIMLYIVAAASGLTGLKRLAYIVIFTNAWISIFV